MGAIIQGKEYRQAKCAECGNEYKTDEMTERGIDPETSSILALTGKKHRTGTDVCLNCIIDSFDDHDKKVREKMQKMEMEEREKFLKARRKLINSPEWRERLQGRMMNKMMQAIGVKFVDELSSGE